MRISRLIILNYRSCACIKLKFEADDPIVLVGPNDSGKTTILNSFKFLFNEKEQVFFSSENSGKNDLSINQVSKVKCEALLEEGFPSFDYVDNISFMFKLDFSDEETLTFLNLDKFSTLLKWVLCNGNSVWIRKTISKQGAMYFVMTNDIAVTTNLDGPEEHFAEFWGKRDTELNKLITDELKKKINNRNGEGKPSGFEKVEVLYRNSGKPYVSRWVNLEYKEYKPLLPEFESFTWNFDLHSIYSLASSFIDSDDKEKIRAIRENADAVESEISKKIKDKMVPTLNVIQASVPSIRDIFAKIYIDINHKITDVLVRKSGFEGDIHVDSQGEGLKRQIWFSLLKSRAQQSIEDDGFKSRFVWTFDEPEIHLYPKAQRDFFESLKQLASKGFQIFINTHSSIFVNKAALSNVYLVSVTDGETSIARCQESSEVTNSLEVQNSDILFYNKFMLVEGVTEVSFFSTLLKEIHHKDLSSLNTKIIELGGGSKTKVALTSLLKIFDGTNHKNESLLILLDKDQEVEHRDLSNTYHVDYLGTYDLEDFLSNEVWGIYLEKAFDDVVFHLKTHEIENLRNKLGQENNKKFMNLLRSYLVMNKAGGDHSLVNISKNKRHGELLALSVIEANQEGDFAKYLKYILE